MQADDTPDEPATFTCPRPECGAVSYHPEDIRHGYCGRCHEFTGQPATGPVNR